MVKITIRGIDPMKSAKYHGISLALLGVIYGLISGILVMTVNVGLGLLTLLLSVVIGAVGGAIFGYVIAMIINFALDKSNGFDIMYDSGAGGKQKM